MTEAARRQCRALAQEVGVAGRLQPGAQKWAEEGPVLTQATEGLGQEDWVGAGAQPEGSGRAFRSHISCGPTGGLEGFHRKDLTVVHCSQFS